MKKAVLAFAAALAVAACSNDAVAPLTADLDLTEASELAFAGTFVADPDRQQNFPPGARFPEELKLTEAQQAQIKALTEAFAQATREAREALKAIMQEARAAHEAGKSQEEIRAILQRGHAIRHALHAAERKLHEQIMGVLTAEQRAWLEQNKPRPCNAPQLTEEQRTQISGLIAAFAEANKADMEAIKAAMKQARDAHKNGATQEQIRAILESVRPNMERVKAAEKALGQAISAVLTEEQRKCFRLPGQRDNG